MSESAVRSSRPGSMEKPAPVGVHLFLLLASVLLIALCFPPLNISAAGLVALMPVFFLCRICRRPEALQYGAMFGVLLSAVFGWGIYAYSPLAFGLVVLFGSGLYALLFAACAYHLRNDRWWSPVLAALQWVLVDVLVSALGVPYSYSLTLTGWPFLIQTAHIGSAHLVSLLVVYFQLVVITVLFSPRRARIWKGHAAMLVIPLLVFIVSPALGYLPKQGELSVSAVQTAFHPYRYVFMTADGVNAANQREINALERSVSGDVDLVVWPELAVRGLQLRSSAFRPRPAGDAWHLLNAPDVDREGRRRYLSYLYNPPGELERVSGKQRLIPIIESSLTAQSTVYEASDSSDTGAPVEHIPRPLICYESALPGVVAQRAAESEFLIIQSSDAYAGPSHIAELNLRHAILRAVENRRDVVRAANGGPSAVISARGDVVGRLSMFAAGVLQHTVSRVQGLTFYARHAEGWLAFFVIGGLTAYVLSQPWLRDTRVPRIRLPTRLVLWGVVLTAAATIIAWQSYTYSTQFAAAWTTTERPGFQARSMYKPFFADAFDSSHFGYTQLTAPDRSESFVRALGFVMRSYGRSVDDETVLRLQPVVQPADPMGATEMTDQLEALGLEDYELQRLSLDQPGLHFPLIAQMGNGEFVVIESIEEERVVIFSPVNGPLELERQYFFDQLPLNSVIFVAPAEVDWERRERF